MGLAKFLAARLDEDKWIAQGAARSDDGRGGKWYPMMFGKLGADARVDDHLAHNDPARVLREVDAKRKIFALHEPNDVTGPGRACQWCGHLWPCEEVRALLSVYSDHPDYDPAWKE